MVHTSTLKRLLILPAVIGLFTISQTATAQDVAEGDKLFNEHCTACHAIDSKVVGPALRGVHERPGRSEEWLINWIKNSPKMIADGDPLAVKLYEENNKSNMNSFEFLDDGQIKSILAYIKEAPAATAGTDSDGGDGGTSTATTTPAAGGGDNFYSTSTLFVLSVLIIVLLAIALLLSRVKVMLGSLLSNKFPEDEALAQKPSWYQAKFLPWLKDLNPTIATLVIFGAVAVLGGGFYFKYANTEIGVQKGYAPTQPIAFDHSKHAGLYKIDCQYCHSTASYSKQASVPAVNTCMNCHSYISAGDNYPDADVSPEIQKIRDAYKNNTPIRWVRIHNLPDHAYFNHAQHVGAGKVECQTCHGPIETMKKVEQHTSLQMGWCINCHREAKVDVENNDYYEKIHEELKGMGRKEYTVEMNGGLECAKCHY
jgi:mono/diheme cytochrome c family protein